jgi:hypothetical protein
MTWICQGDVDSLLITDPLGRRCSLTTREIPACQEWWEEWSEPDTTDNSASAQFTFLTASLENPVTGNYSMEAVASDSTSVYISVVVHRWPASGIHSCAADTRIERLASRDRAIRTVAYAVCGDSCELEIGRQ